MTEKVLWVEPLLNGVSYSADITDKILNNTKALCLTIRPIRQNLLIGPRLQTCATVVQYLAGFSVGAIRVQKLYDLLTKKSPEWLKSKGILEVKPWVPSQTS